jgi:hypothetical protein
VATGDIVATGGCASTAAEICDGEYHSSKGRSANDMVISSFCKQRAQQRILLFLRDSGNVWHKSILKLA